MGIFDFLNKKRTSPEPQKPDQPPQSPQTETGLMSKADVEQVLVRVTIDNEDVLLVKIYKNGTVVRAGMAGLPMVQVSTLSQVSNAAETWDGFMETVPQRLLEEDTRQEAPKITRPFSYTVAFFGDSANGDTGEYAAWRRTQGIEIVGNLEGPYHPLHGLLEQVVVSSMRFTNSLYLDIMVFACFDLKARNMAQGMMSMGKDAKRETTWNDYMVHLVQGPFAKDIAELTAGKVFENPSNGHSFKLAIGQRDGRLRYEFIPAI